MNLAMKFSIVWIVFFSTTLGFAARTAAPVKRTVLQNIYKFTEYPQHEVSAKLISDAEKTIKEEIKREPADVSAEGLKSVLDKDTQYQTFKKSYLALPMAIKDSATLEKKVNPLILEKFIEDQMTAIQKGEITSVNVKFAVAQMQMLRAFRSFTYRIRPYVDDVGIVNSMLLTMGYNIYQAQKTYFDSDHAKAVMVYVSEPFTEADVNAKISTSAEFQDFLYKELYKHLYDAENIFRGIAYDAQNKVKNPFIVVDAELAQPGGLFRGGLEQYKALGLPELFAVMAGYESTMSQIAFSVSYDFTDSMNIIKESGTYFGFKDGSFGTTIEGLPASERYKMLSKYPNFLTLKLGSKESLKNSYTSLKNSVIYADLAWSHLNKRPAGTNQYFMNLNFIDGYRNQTGLSISKWKEIVNATGPVTITSNVTGNPQLVNLSKIFDESSAIKDFKAFLPVPPFEHESKLLKKPIIMDGKKEMVGYRNFNRGSAINWNTEAFRPYFPKVGSSEDIRGLANVLAGAWGTSAFTMPFSFVIQ